MYSRLWNFRGLEIWEGSEDCSGRADEGLYIPVEDNREREEERYHLAEKEKENGV